MMFSINGQINEDRFNIDLPATTPIAVWLRYVASVCTSTVDVGVVK
jgi:hypothetical protein